MAWMMMANSHSESHQSSRTSPFGTLSAPIPFMKFLRLIFLALACASCISVTSAHQVDSVELKFVQTEDKWILKGLLDIAYMMPESRGIADAPPLFRKDVMAEPKAKHDHYLAQSEVTMRKLLTLKFNGKVLKWKIDFPEFEKQPLVLPTKPAVGH